MEAESSSSVSSATFDDLNKRIQTSALMTTRKSAVLPADINFHRSMDQGLAKDIDALSSRVLSLTNKLLDLVASVDVSKAGKGKGKERLLNQDDVADNFHAIVVDSMDRLFENTDMCLDQYLGRNKAPAIAINPAQISTKPSKKPTGLAQAGTSDQVIQHATHLSKPQLRFSRPPDNSDAPWYPSLSHKYNAKVPLGHNYVDSGDELESTNLIANHPYRYEITHLTHPPQLFTSCTPVLPPPLEETEPIFVDTQDAFQKMLCQLKEAKEIAVDLEHHSYRSYSGFLCLMQLSDRKNDWIVDLLAVRDEVQAINEVFTDPTVVKVFHGADSDVVWLQQDFSVYIVNLFDTFHASKLLEFPRHGLANLLEMYCDFVPDKRYQLADWRIRPLPKAMLQYAQSDTHFLLYIYDNLRNALLDRSKSQANSRAASSSPDPEGSSTPKEHALLHEALSRSAETSLRVYAKDAYDMTDGTGVGGWDTLAKKWNKVALTAGGPGVGVGAMQREVYRSVHWWREKVAREEDESTRYVLQNHVLFQLAEQPPADMAALLNMFRGGMPPVLKKRAKELLNVVKDAVKRGMEVSQPKHLVKEKEDRLGSNEDMVMLEAEVEKLDEKNSGDDSAVQTSSLWGSRMCSVVSQTLWPPLTYKMWSENAGTLKTPESSLFGTSKKPQKKKSQPKKSSITTEVSTLFGSRFSQAHSSKPSQHTKFSEVVSRIHELLVLSPSLPQVCGRYWDCVLLTFLTLLKLSAIRQIKTEEPTPTTTNISAPVTVEENGMQVEIPFLPASQRQPKKEEEQDTIIVVGQARQKRKRANKQAEGGKGTKKAAAESTPATSEETSAEPFDFSTAPNILDDNPDEGDTEEAKRKKKRVKKASKGAGQFYGDFPAPPKAQNEVKSGNQSHTFRK
ncbi:hypothetical protein CVT24_006622 [Panaeolus cyanescens]|uniref:HRDC domain-containing protein n=1 Tax=Panaeolus cyanescens TaxID=181874 RepID=A0A409YS94_9AGAR|nr:hypothetical protein CVT24_006622 [Panaeolus cyanescens]